MTTVVSRGRSALLIGGVFWCLAGIYSGISMAAELSDDALAGVSAKGDISTGGGSLATSCQPSPSSICTGVFSWTDSHAYDSSQYKGAIHQDGYVQQNLTANINVDATESSIATGANVVSNVTAATGATINLSNNENSVEYIGGF